MKHSTFLGTTKFVVAKKFIMTLVLILAGVGVMSAKDLNVTVTVYCDHPEWATFEGKYVDQWSQQQSYDFPNSLFELVTSGEYAGYYKATKTVETWASSLPPYQINYCNFVAKPTSGNFIWNAQGIDGTTITTNPDKAWTLPVSSSFANGCQVLWEKVTTKDISRTYLINVAPEETKTLDLTVYCNDPSMLSDNCGGVYRNSRTTTTPYSMTFSAEPEASGDYAGYYKGTVSLSCYKLGGYNPMNSTLTLETVDGDHYIVKLDGEYVTAATTMTLFNQPVMENESHTYVVDVVKKETQTLNVCVLNKGNAVCKLAGTELAEGNQDKTFDTVDDQPMSLTITEVPEGMVARVFLNNEPLTGTDNAYSFTCYDGDKLYIVFEDPNASTETIEMTSTLRYTYCSHHNLVFNETETTSYVRAYKVTEFGTDEFTAEPLVGVVPAGVGLYLEGVIVNGPALARYTDAVSRAGEGRYEFTMTTTTADPTVDMVGNLLLPVYQYQEVPMTDETSTPISNIFIYDPQSNSFINNNEEPFNTPYNQAYIMITSTQPMPQPIPIPTGIDTIEADAQAPAMTGIFSLSGVRFPDNTDVKSLAPGFYIVNGKKFLVK